MRKANGIIAAIISVFFLVHALLGAFSAHFAIPTGLSVLVWVGVAWLMVHVVLSVFTSREMLTDEVRPPSAKKRQHLVMKWLTGAALLVFAALHGLGIVSGTAALVVTVCLAVTLAVHICYGSKSLLKDLGADKRYRTPLRITACVLAGIACIVLLTA